MLKVENSHGKDSISYTVRAVRAPVAPTIRYIDDDDDDDDDDGDDHDDDDYDDDDDDDDDYDDGGSHENRAIQGEQDQHGHNFPGLESPSQWRSAHTR